MSLSSAQLKSRLTLAAILVLALGLASALLVYAFAEEAAPEAIGYIVVDGIKYPIEPGQSKRYVRDLERYGGKANVVFDEFGRWFAALWQGKQLGVTVACLSLVIASAMLLFAASLPADRPVDRPPT